MGKNRRSIYYTSDWHLGHFNAIVMSDRPFKTLQEMEDFILNDYKSKVRENDIVYFLGDIFWNTMPKKKIRSTLDSLPGKKILIIGNHDKLTPAQAMGLGFDFACYEATIKINGHYVRLSHYPYRNNFWKDLRFNIKEFFRTGKLNWKYLKHVKKRPIDLGGWLVYGHTHSKKKQYKKTIHIGVDAWGYKLVNQSQIVSLMDRYKG